MFGTAKAVGAGAAKYFVCVGPSDAAAPLALCFVATDGGGLTYAAALPPPDVAALTPGVPLATLLQHLRTTLATPLVAAFSGAPSPAARLSFPPVGGSAVDVPLPRLDADAARISLGFFVSHISRVLRAAQDPVGFKAWADASVAEATARRESAKAVLLAAEKGAEEAEAAAAAAAARLAQQRRAVPAAPPVDGLPGIEFVAAVPPPGSCVARLPLRVGARPGSVTEATMALIKGVAQPPPEDGSEPPAAAGPVAIPRLAKAAHAKALSVLSDRGVACVLEALKLLDVWEYDVFCVHAMTNGAPLFVTTWALLLRLGLFDKLSLDEGKVLNLLAQLEAGYHPNPYHNNVHAADVAHVLSFILRAGGASAKLALTPAQEFAAVLAAAAHDYDHPGLNNAFHTKTHSYLARLYNDRSVLEAHHVAETLEIMKEPALAVLDDIPPDAASDVRETLVEMILGTDMGRHMEIVRAWKDAVGAGLTFEKDTAKRQALVMALKVADISNCGRPLPMYMKWALRISDEFFLQGDRERNLGIPISPLMNRRTPSMAKSQTAFMDFIVSPLFETFADVFPQMRFTLNLVDANREFWTAHGDDPPAYT